jgi:type I restriction enzyme, S subunit
VTTELPHGWSVRTIGSVAEVNPRRPSQLRTLRDDYPVTFVPMPAVDEDSGSIASAQTRPFGEVKKGFTYFAEGDVIFAKITPCMQNGKSAIATGLTNGLGFGSTEFHVLRAKPGATCAEWLWYFVRNPEFREEATYHFQGAVGQQRVPMEFLAEHQIPVPPLNEQRRVVARIRLLMDRAEEVRSLQGARARELEKLVPATLDDVFAECGGKDVALGDVLECDPQNGLYLPKDQYSDRGIPMVHMGDMFRRFELAGVPARRVLADLKLIDKYGLRPDDVLVARRSLIFEGSGSMTVVGLLAEPTLFESSIIRARFRQSAVLPAFVVSFFYSREGTSRRLEIARKATISGINQDGLLRLKIPAPSLELQRAALQRIGSIRSLHMKLVSEDTTSLMGGLPSAILRKAFAGEL